MTDCYIGLGGNFPQTFLTMQQAVQKMALIEGILNISVSPVYCTTPVSDIPQPLFLNAVCRFTCQLSPEKLWETLQEIEKESGKVPKAKQAPRLIDLDLLFFGDKVYYSSALVLPHPKWHERLFVLAPLADLTDTVPLDINVKELLEKFSNPHHEEVEVCALLT